MEVPKDGESKYLYSVLEPMAKADMWIHAIESISTNRKAIHHQSFMKRFETKVLDRVAYLSSIHLTLQ